MAERSAAELAAIGLGANLGDPVAQIEAAIAAIAHLPDTGLVGRSGLWRSPPWGITEQPEFVNAACLVRTGLAPVALLEALLAIERSAGRVRGESRFGPRRLDLDLLVHGARRVELPRCRVPHPELARRAFVLVPLAEIAPTLMVPGLGTVAALLERLPAPERDALRRLRP